MENFFEKIETLVVSLDKYKSNKDKLLNSIKSLSTENKEEIDYLNQRIDSITDKLQDITNDIEDFQYIIDQNEIKLNLNTENRIKDYEINNKVYETFTPYMLMYSILLNNERA